MNPLNLLADADMLRISGEHHADRITWRVEAHIPGPYVAQPGQSHTLLEFEAPVGDDDADAFAIPEGLECLVAAAATLYGMGISAAPVTPPRPPIALPDEYEGEATPAPRCTHNYLNAHTWHTGSLESGYLETVCPGPDRPHEGRAILDALYAKHSNCCYLEGEPDDKPLCTHGHTHPHGTDALDRGPTCPGPTGQWPEGYEPITETMKDYADRMTHEATQGTLPTPPYPEQPAASKEPRRTPVCATCGESIRPAQGWGRGWTHIDKAHDAAHVPAPKVHRYPEGADQ